MLRPGLARVLVLAAREREPAIVWVVGLKGLKDRDEHDLRKRKPGVLYCYLEQNGVKSVKLKAGKRDLVSYAGAAAVV